MAKDPASPFRTRVRVKGVATEAVPSNPAVHETAPADSRLSLMEALKRAKPPPPSGKDQQPEVERSESQHAPRPAPVVARWKQEQTDAEPPRRVRRPSRRVGRLAAAKLRQLARLKEAASSLESLARGEFEEATVEIVRRDRKTLATDSRTRD